MKNKIIIAILVISIFAFFKLAIEMPSIFLYNEGNNLYNKGDYSSAIKEYDTALNLFPSKYKECKIRINMALSMLKTIEENDDIGTRLDILKLARQVLTDKGCANKDDDNGHSKEAEKLKKDIDREIARLNLIINPSNGSDSEEEAQENKDQNQESQSTQNKQSEAKLEQLQKIQKQGTSDRNQDLKDLKQQTSSSLFYHGKNW